MRKEAAVGRKHQLTRSFEHACRECSHPMDMIQQENSKGGFIALITCWNPDCLLKTVTLSIDQYAKLTECQIEAYREMNRNSRRKYASG